MKKKKKTSKNELNFYCKLKSTYASQGLEKLDKRAIRKLRLDASYSNLIRPNVIELKVEKRRTIK